MNPSLSFSLAVLGDISPIQVASGLYSGAGSGHIAPPTRSIKDPDHTFAATAYIKSRLCGNAKQMLVDKSGTVGLIILILPRLPARGGGLSFF